VNLPEESTDEISAIDPYGDDFIAQFDRAFGMPDGDERVDDTIDGDAIPATPLPAVTRAPSLLRRVVMRIIRRPSAWVRRPWAARRVVQVSATAATLIVTTYIMMNVVHLDPFDRGDDLIFDDVTPTGGDYGGHVWAPAFLRDHLLPNWQLSGWSMDWYGGIPLYRFYMVIPALAMVALDTVLPYGVAFKVVAISGLVTLPLSCWAFGRLARFRYPIPELFAFAAICFMLNESTEIFGGNVLATMAGEFSFSIAVSLMMLGLGLLARGLDDGKANVLVWAAVVLALACLSHGIVLIYTAVGALVMVGCRSGVDAVRALTRRAGGRSQPAKLFVTRLLFGLSVGGLTVLLAAFWVGPFLFDHDYMTDMKYVGEPRTYYDTFWPMIFDQEPLLDVVINTLAIAGFVAAIVRRHVYGVAIGVTTLIAVALVFLTRDSLPGIGLLWNPRVLPWVYLMRYLMMMVGAAEVGGWAVNYFRNRPARADNGAAGGTVVLAASGLVVLVIFGFVFQALPGGGKIGDQYAWGPIRSNHGFRDARGGGWTAWNFRGYEGRRQYPEYYDLIQTMDTIGAERGCGRALWEVDTRDSTKNRYGTTMALMLLPHWTDGCIASMEGVFFEASGTTPYHFLTASAMSHKASNPVRQLRYTRNDAEVGIEYVQALGIRYVMVTTHEANAEAEARPELELIAESGPWHIYEVAGAAIVAPLTVQPVVVNGRDGDQRECFLELGSSWFRHQEEWAAMPATGGPDSWQRIDVAIDEEQMIPDDQPTDRCGDPDDRPSERKVHVVAPVPDIDVVELPAVTVSNVDIDQQSLAFDVSEPGVPILVRVSYFPNWSADGAEGPYRIGPNQMVVIPTDTHVTLSFERSTSDRVFYGLTILGIAVAVFARFTGDWRFPTPNTRRPDNVCPRHVRSR
jgi:hypothetical protein